MTKREIKRRLRIVKRAIRNAWGTDRIVLESELETLEYLLMRG